MEIFSVTKDHWDFCETLDLIYAIFRNNKGEASSEKKNSMDSETLDKQVSNLNVINENELKMIQTLNTFLNCKTKYTEQEKKSIQEKFKAKDPFLFSSLEFYLNNEDDNELLENLDMYKKK